MLIKVSLIVAILAGLGALVVSHVQVAEKIKGLQTDLETTQASLKTSQDAEAKAKQEARDSKKLAETTKKSLDEATANLEAMTSRADTLDKRASAAEADLNKTRTELTEAQRSLTRWVALGRPVDQIEKDLAELVRATAANEALVEEKKVMLRKITSLEMDLAKFIQPGEQPPPALPPGLKGKVVAVDPKWDFVVLNIGSQQGVLKRGELLVDRDGKLVAKLRVTRVDTTNCVANVLGDWKQAEVMEGDEVLPSL